MRPPSIQMIWLARTFPVRTSSSLPALTATILAAIAGLPDGGAELWWAKAATATKIVMASENMFRRFISFSFVRLAGLAGAVVRGDFSPGDWESNRKRNLRNTA